MISVAGPGCGPARLARIALCVVVGDAVVDVPDQDPGLRDGQLEAGLSSVLDEQVLSGGEAGRDFVHCRVVVVSVHAVCATRRDTDRRQPTQEDLAPGAEGRRVELRAVGAPGVAHEAPGGNAGAAAVAVIQVSDAQEVSGWEVRVGLGSGLGLGLGLGLV